DGFATEDEIVASFHDSDRNGDEIPLRATQRGETEDRPVQRLLLQRDRRQRVGAGVAKGESLALGGERRRTLRYGGAHHYGQWVRCPRRANTRCQRRTASCCQWSRLRFSTPGCGEGRSGR